MSREPATWVHSCSERHCQEISSTFFLDFFLVHFKCSLITSLNTRNSSWLFTSVCWEFSSSTAHHQTIIFQSRMSRWTRKTTFFNFLSAAASWRDCVELNDDFVYSFSTVKLKIEEGEATWTWKWIWIFFWKFHDKKNKHWILKIHFLWSDEILKFIYLMRCIKCSSKPEMRDWWKLLKDINLLRITYIQRLVEETRFTITFVEENPGIKIIQKIKIEIHGNYLIFNRNSRKFYRKIVDFLLTNSKFKNHRITAKLTCLAINNIPKWQRNVLLLKVFNPQRNSNNFHDIHNILQ